MDKRAVFTAVVYVPTSGGAQRLLPPSVTVHRRFSVWTVAGLGCHFVAGSPREISVGDRTWRGSVDGLNICTEESTIVAPNRSRAHSSSMTAPCPSPHKEADDEAG